MDNYKIADEIRKYNKSARKLKKAAAAMCVAGTASFIAAGMCKYLENKCKQKRRNLFNSMDI